MTETSRSSAFPTLTRFRLAAALSVMAAVGRGAAHLDLSELEATCPLIFGSLLSAAAGTSPVGCPMRVVVTADGTFVAVTSSDESVLGAVEAGARKMTVEQVIGEARGSGGDAVVVSAPKHLLADERLRSRGFWRADQAPIEPAHSASRPGLLSPLASGTARSSAHTMFATSSRTSQISSVGGPSCTFDTVGISTRLVSAATAALPTTVSVNTETRCLKQGDQHENWRAYELGEPVDVMRLDDSDAPIARPKEIVVDVQPLA